MNDETDLIDVIGLPSSRALTYKDYAEVPAPPECGESKYRGGITTHFPALLHALLTKAEVDGYNDICSWYSHGRAFAVHDRDKFVSEVMPLYFRQTQFASFQRQLNLYEFHRLCHESYQKSAGSYYHPMFLRTRHDLCPAIQRPTEKELKEAKKTSRPNPRGNPNDDPDFSTMRPMPPSRHKHITAARNITLPQRKAPSFATKEEEPPKAAKMGQPGAVAKKPTELLAGMLGHSSTNQVSDAYESLFLVDGATSQEEVDLSWMEPRPIAPELVPLLRNSQVLADPPNVRDFMLQTPVARSFMVDKISNREPLLQSHNGEKKSRDGSMIGESCASAFGPHSVR